MKFRISCFLSIFIASNCIAYSQDTGRVERVFVNSAGAIALQIEGGFKKALETNQCETNNGWAGLSSADPALKSVIIAAKAAGTTLTVTIEGCEGSSWFKVKDLYMN